MGRIAKRIWFGVSGLLALAMMVACTSTITVTEGPRDPELLVGQPCTPLHEADASFMGFATNEASAEDDGVQCGDGGVCLVNHFQGRIDCPLGQDGNGCKTPNGEAVSGPVCGQCSGRPQADTVHCSCRCALADAPPEPNESYCVCGDGFVCAGLGASDVAFGYCVKESAVWDAANDQSCGDVPGHWEPKCDGVPAP